MIPKTIVVPITCDGKKHQCPARLSIEVPIDKNFINYLDNQLTKLGWLVLNGEWCPRCKDHQNDEE